MHARERASSNTILLEGKQNECRIPITDPGTHRINKYVATLSDTIFFRPIYISPLCKYSRGAQNSDRDFFSIVTTDRISEINRPCLIVAFVLYNLDFVSGWINPFFLSLSFPLIIRTVVTVSRYTRKIKISSCSINRHCEPLRFPIVIII